MEYLKDIKRNIKSHDIITIVGGGNMGNIYENYEELRRLVIKTFKNNFIVSFPQTIDFSNDSEGNKSLNKSKKIINKHKNILVLAREQKSYEKMKKEFNCKVELVPDIVFSLKNKLNFGEIKRTENIGICFRDDKEKNNGIEIYKDKIIKNIDNYEFFSTYIGDDLIYENRYVTLKKLLEKIATYRYIITDRLHAMIFAYLTDTPCYFFDNSNKKISETYKTWLTKCKNIHEVKNFKYEEVYNCVIDKDEENYFLNNKFNELIAEIKKNIKEK